MDEIDRRILSALQKDGRLPVTDLAERVGLSPTPCARRMARMEQEGLITGYAARVDPEKLGFPITVFVFAELERQHRDALEGFERAIRRFPEVLECHLMAGTADYILKVVAEDTEDFARIHRQYLTRLPGVAQMQSSFALRTVFKTTALPV